MTRVLDTVVVRWEPRLQDLAAIISDSRPPLRQWVGLATVAADVAASLKEPLAAANIDLAIEGEAVVGHWNQRLIELICFCVLTNAIRCGEGQPVDLFTRGDGHQAELVVIARGTAIGDGDLGGGLPSARALAGRLGGTLVATANPSRGTTVIVTLPRRAS